MLDSGMEGRDYFLPFHLVMLTPKDTAKTALVETEVILPIGRINRLWVEFPKGCMGLAGFQIWRGARQIFPVVQGQFMTGDGIFIPLAFTHILESEPLQIIGKSYNLDDTYSHTMTVIIEMSGNGSEPSENFQAFLNTLG